MHGLNTNETKSTMEEKIRLAHGGGGRQGNRLVREIFLSRFGADDDVLPGDSALLDIQGQLLAFTTDSFVIDPLFFPGGDIGKLAVCGTVNDLSVAGAVPLVLSAGFIIEEGLSMDILNRVAESMARTAAMAGVKIVCGDTKVVNRGKCDKLFINTSGIGRLDEENRQISSGNNIIPGDRILINGAVGSHGVAVMAARNQWALDQVPHSDCAALNQMIRAVLESCKSVRFMRDATRGGVAGVLYEMVAGRDIGVTIEMDKVPMQEGAEALCEMLGFDPLAIANEGKVIMVVDYKEAELAIEIMRRFDEGREADEIGEITDADKGLVVAKLTTGVKRIIPEPEGELLPRIC